MTLDQAFDAGLLIDEAGRPIVSRKQLADAKWITVHPNGAGSKGTPVQISENGTVLAGMGGKFNGKKLGELKGGSAASQHIEKTLSASAERIRQSVPSKLKETAEQRQTVEHYVAKHQAAERAMLEKFHRERENNPGWSVTGRSGRKISNTSTPLENLARESQTLKSIESEMVAKLESMRPASSVTAAEHTKLGNNVTRSVVGVFAGTHTKAEAVKAIKALATANPSKLSERLTDIEKSLVSRGSSLESLFGKSGASASLIKSHLSGSGLTVEQSNARQSSEKFTGSWLTKTPSETRPKTKDPVINTNSSSSEILSTIERHARSLPTSKQRINARNRMKKSAVESLESDISNVKSQIRVEMSKGARQGELRDLYAKVSVLERKRDDVTSY